MRTMVPTGRQHQEALQFRLILTGKALVAMEYELMRRRLASIYVHDGHVRHENPTVVKTGPGGAFTQELTADEL